MSLFFSLLAAMASPGEQAFALFFLFVVVILALISSAVRGSANYDVQIKGGAPYCPNCNRQVSYRRESCRSCGYTFVSYGSSESTQPFVDPTSSALGGCLLGLMAMPFRLMFVVVLYLVIFIQKRVWPQACHLCSGKWYGTLPEWAQPVVLGCLIPLPAIIVFVLFRHFLMH